MADRKKGSLGSFLKLEQQLEHPVCSFGVELSRRLISEYDCGPVRQGASDGNPLFFAATECRRVLVGKVLDVEFREQRFEPFLIVTISVFLREDGILPGSEIRDELELLEYEPKRLATKARAFGFGERVSLSIHDFQCSTRWSVE